MSQSLQYLGFCVCIELYDFNERMSEDSDFLKIFIGKQYIVGHENTDYVITL